MTPKALNDLKNRVGEWTNRNFSYHDPAMGMLEEVGEMAHCFLKAGQRIRGFDKEDHFRKKFADALADIGIYCLNFCDIEGVVIQTVYTKLMYDEPRDAVAELSFHCYTCLRTKNRDPEDLQFAAQHIFECLCALARLVLKQEYWQILIEEWARVSQRDWIKFPKDGLKE
jgi:NTP pyrophosphatase (non-canonical NTP hydrolase)